MRDEYDGRLWTAGHDRFSSDVEAALGALARSLPRPRLPRVPPQLIAALAAVGITLVTFTGSAA